VLWGLEIKLQKSESRKRRRRYFSWSQAAAGWSLSG
jgi:hypothetical protein